MNLATILASRTEQPAWVALESDDLELLVEDLEIELEGEVVHEVIRVDGLSDDEIREMDRTRVRRVGTTTRILLGTASDLDRVARLAPHVWSLVGPDYHVVEPDPEFDVEARLAALREMTGLSDDEVLRRAENNALNGDPVWAEWLALLGRGELLGA